jgi:hypothetical protein
VAIRRSYRRGLCAARRLGASCRRFLLCSWEAGGELPQLPVLPPVHPECWGQDAGAAQRCQEVGGELQALPPTHPKCWGRAASEACGLSGRLGVSCRIFVHLAVLVGCRKSPQRLIFRNGGCISVVMNIWVLCISVVVLMCILLSFWYLFCIFCVNSVYSGGYTV